MTLNIRLRCILGIILFACSFGWLRAFLETHEWQPADLCPPNSDFDYPCPSHTHFAGPIRCIPTAWLCDNEPDCPDGTDEGTGPGEPCHEVTKIECDGEDNFLCKSEQLCITKAWKCDGDLDCDDGSDEHIDNCPHLKHIIPCTPNQYQCPGSQKCIPYSKVCDNHFDCDSGTDEYSCRRPCKESVSCLQCVDKEGAKCYCDNGFQWNGENCTDLDECQYDQYCDHMDMCTNSDGGFNCSCREGYMLENYTRCIAINEPKDQPGTLLLAKNWDVRQLDMDGNHLNLPYVIGGQRIVSVDFDFKNKKICWISLNGNTGRSSLLCSSADDPSIPVEQMQIKVYLSTVESFAYDWIHRNWYFADPVLKRIVICNKNGQFCNIVVGEGDTEGVYSPHNLALDPINGYLYFTDLNDKNRSFSKIMKCRLDGLDLKPFISEKIRYPAGLAIDYANSHFYWSDRELKVVERIDLDGNEDSKRVIAIGSKVENIHSLDILENYLYLSDGHEKQILKIHRYNYGIPTESLVGNLSRPEQIRIYHKQRQPQIETNPCDDSGCQHICTSYIDQGTRQTSCLCAVGHTLNAKTCEVVDECKRNCTGKNCDMKYIRDDSATCTLELCIKNTSFCASSGTCLPSVWWCDGKVDCPSGEDEGIYCRYRECSLGTEFQCASGNCVDFSLRCNRFDDCGDGTDEIGCEYPCDQMNQFQCKEDPNHCIPEIFVCDGHPDCVNGSDEHGDHCDPGLQFQCQPDTEYQCRNGDCISLSWKCDNEPDCADGSDEWEGEVCNKNNSSCKSNERPCDTNKRCIPAQWFCDGEPDCLDRSDEADRYCSNDTDYHCPHPNVRCEKETIRMCLRPEQMCDGNKDCDDDTDEGRMCKDDICGQTNYCDGTCHNIPTAPGYVCSCPPNKKLDSDNVTCVDAVPVDELCNQWGICGQDCELTNTTTAGYRCKCFNGFFLEPDKFTCKPLESDPVHVVFSNRHELRRVDVMSSNAISLVSGLRNTIAIDFYYKEGYAVLFWTDVMEDKIYRGTMMGNNLINVEPIITSGLATTEGVAVDWVAENIYWVESSLDQIEVAKLDGSKRTTLIAGSMKSPRAIVLDPRDGKLFWTDWDGDNPRIEMCSMSGDNRTVIHNITPAEGGGWPNGLTIDYDFRRLYWIDARSESIHTIDYQGGDSRLILKGHKDMTHPFAMSLFGNYVYWTDWSTNSVVRANKFNGSNVEQVQKTITQPFDLQVIHPKRQPFATNPCTDNNGGCSDLCLINLDGKAGCRCPHRKRLKDDNKSCVDDVKFMLFIKNQEIRGVDLEKADFNVIPVITVPDIDQPQAIDYDPDNDTLYWVDNSLKVINRANFNGDVETLIDKGLDNPEAFAVDWLSKNMYFSSYNLDKNIASISVATLQGTFRRELIKKDLGKPNSIALDPYGGNMYFTDVNGSAGTHKLYRAQLDGGYPVVLLSDLNQPKSLTFYQGQLYFINKGDNSIMTCDTVGQNARTISNVDITRPSVLTVYKSLLYVSDGDKIVSVNKTDGSDYKLIRDSTPNVNALLIYDEQEREKRGDNPCHNGKSGCSQLCLPTSKTLNMCKCTAGYDLAEDNKICQGIRKFLLYAKETEIRGQKFAQSTTEALVPISQIQSASAIDFLASEDYVFWVDQKANSISRIKRDSTKRAVIVRDGINSVEGLAVDWIAGHIYWTDAGHSTIEVAKVDGSNRYVIASGSMEKPCSVVVHPELGYLYWSDWGTEPRIERARLDGSNRHLYIYSGMVKPWGLTIDYETHVLYWCDAGLQTIERVDLLTSGSYKRQVLIDLRANDGKDHQPVSLTIFGDKIYWIDRNDDGAIYSALKTNGADVTKIRGDLGDDLKDIKSFDGSRQSGMNPCQQNNGGCKELCFYLGNSEVRCACSYGKLYTDNRSCVDYEGFLMYSKVTGLESINLHDANNKNHPVTPIKNDTYLRNVIGLTFDYHTQRIFYSDIQRGDIQYVNFKGKNITVVVDGIGSAEGLAFVKGKLYWTSYTNSCISSIDVEEALTNRSKKPDVVIQMSKMDHPRAIVADSCWELIYWTNWNSEKPRIQRATLLGLNPTDVITKDIVTPNGLAIDHIGKKLYWSDARLDKIERCDMDGTNRHVIITAIPHHSFGLAIYGNYLYWTDWMLRAVVRANKYDGTGIVWLRKNLERQPMGIVAVADDSNDCTLNACHADNNNCSDKCYTDETGQPFCQCTYGRLKADGKSCALPHQCDPRMLGYEPFMCHSDGRCIHFYKSCNGVPDCADGSDELLSVCANRECPPTMFTCLDRAQGQCIPLSKKCDMQLDCKDGSDESYEFCQCPPGHFLCNESNECIPKAYRCDGNADCADSSDEKGCDAFVCGAKEKKCATFNDCIPADRWCDGYPDCQDHSDENATVCNGTESTCGSEMYRCDNGQCIYEAWYCDKDEDCEDGSDEKNCNHTCKEGFLMCQDDKRCISTHWKCDGNNDCNDGSDELNCDQTNCTEEQYTCSTGRCISKSWLCDGEIDCQNGEDESSKVGCDPVVCFHDEFICANNQCIDKEYYCDKDDDCGDGSDERDCDYSNKCLDTQFECDEGYCISKELRCNGEPNCADGSDEKDCEEPLVPCSNSSLYQCRNGVCLTDDLVCNGRDDCGDNSDEPGNCGINECITIKHACSQKCKDKKIGYECSCEKGFKLDMDQTSCIDIDECSTTYPCDQYCYNLHGSYYCGCAEHYELLSDKHHCRLTNDEGKPYLLVSNRFYIRKVYLNGTHKIIVKDLTHSVAIDFDFQTKTLFWTDIHSQSSTINSIVIDSPDAKPVELHSSTVLNPDGIAVDWVGRNLYWCDRNTDTIEVSKLDGKYRKILVRDKTFLREPRALEIFPKYGYLYLTDWGDEPHISRISLDGSIKEHIITEEIAWPNALTIDYVTEKLFWADANFDYIAMADLNGKNRHVIVNSDLPHTFAITTFMERLYWTDWETNSIFSVEKFSGKKRTKLVTMAQRPMDLVVYHRMRQPEMKPNPCEALNCSHLCLLRPSDVPGKVEATCACPEHHRMDPGKKNCTAECNKSQFLCVSSSKCIPLWWKCDNHTDCDDGSDEPDDCPMHYCSHPGLFQCENATSEKDCIPPIGICDGVSQCADGSDETYMNNCSEYTCMTHQIQCPGNFKCISESKWCDHHQDCPGGEDEANCTATPCQETHFKCNRTGTCIPYLWQCDGDHDCHDGSDEIGCGNRTCIEDFIKCEKTLKCIPASWKCDGEHDCGADDDTDEKQDLCAKVTCQPSYHRCHNSHCVPGRWVCDDDKDCSDGSDELNCQPKNCSADEFKCTNNNRCVPKSALCDGKFDCRDNSDEAQDCQHVNQCTADQFKCKAGTIICIPNTWKCDGDEDCMDGSDERECRADCHPSEFQCKNSTECIPNQFRCDTEQDCVDGSDELGCENYACLTAKLRCDDHTCIAMHKKCDGVPDCADGSDEKKSMCAKSTLHCEGYWCNDNRTCILSGQVCDGVPDCDNGDDELPAVCESNTTCKLYQQICGLNSDCIYYKNISLTSCKCKDGFKMSTENVCTVHDPCADWKTCSQHCTQVKGNRIRCSCQEGYQYSAEKDMCIAKGENKPVLMVIEDDRIMEQAPTFTWTEPANRSIDANDSKITAVDIDMSSESMKDWMMFLVYKDRKVITTHEMMTIAGQTPVNGSGRVRRDVPLMDKEKIIVSELSQPSDIAVDWIGKHIYWTDTGLKRIQMCKYDGSRHRTVIKDRLNRPSAIVVEPNLGKIFWTDVGYPPKIESAHLDGTNRRTLVSVNLILPYGLAIDYPNQRLYWTDTKSHTVETSWLDGSDRKIVRKFNSTDPPHKVDVFEDYLYVSTYKKHRVLKFHKFYDEDTNNSTLTLRPASPLIGDILIYHQSKQLARNESVNQCSKDPCNSNKSKQLCINNPANVTSRKYTCVCPDGADYDPADKKCSFKLCPPNHCRNNGTCHIVRDEFKCSCPDGFTGKRCEIDQCYNYCPNGHCSVSKNGTPNCVCLPGFKGRKCDQYVCSGYCKNLGICQLDQSGNPKCLCLDGYTGTQCEQQIQLSCTDFCVNNGTCTIDSKGRRTCTCLPEFAGERCDQCGLQHSVHLCYNGGVCTINNSVPVCKCPPGFDPRTDCKKRTCDGYCMNEALCTLNGNQLTCQCQAGFDGPRCSNYKDKCSPGYCKNNGTCVLNNAVSNNNKQKKASCQCPTGFFGSYCENELKRCFNFCKNGGNCTFSNGDPYCTCPTFYKGKRCEQCTCVNGECSEPGNGPTRCLCNNLYEGQFCNRSICHDYCFNNGVCQRCEKDSNTGLGVCQKCKCLDDFDGIRCETRIRIKQAPKQQSTYVPVVVPIVIILIVVLAILLFVVIKKKRSAQFRHSRLKEGNNLNVTNPIYMPQTMEEEDLEDSRQPLDQPYDFYPEKATNFANPVYEQFFNTDSRQQLLPKDDSDNELEISNHKSAR